MKVTQVYFMNSTTLTLKLFQHLSIASHKSKHVIACLWSSLMLSLWPCLSKQPVVTCLFSILTSKWWNDTHNGKVTANPPPPIFWLNPYIRQCLISCSNEHTHTQMHFQLLMTSISSKGCIKCSYYDSLWTKPSVKLMEGFELLIQTIRL